MNKLVRDQIPEIIPPEDLNLFKFSEMSDPEYSEHLKKKLAEEVNEYLESENIEELADIYEVIDAIIKFKSFDLDEIKKVKQKKREQRGGFEKRILMQRITE